MPKEEISISEAARQLEVPSRTLRRYCERLGIGRKVLSVWVLTRADVKKLKAAGAGRRVGNPVWIAAKKE